MNAAIETAGTGLCTLGLQLSHKPSFDVNQAEFGPGEAAEVTPLRIQRQNFEAKNAKSQSCVKTGAERKGSFMRFSVNIGTPYRCFDVYFWKAEIVSLAVM